MSLGGRVILILAAIAGALLMANAAVAWPQRPVGMHFMDETLSVKPERYQELESALNKLSLDSGCDVRLGVLKSMEGKDSATAGQDVVKAWNMGIGFGEGKYILILVFPGDREMRTEYGKALNGTGMDAYLQEITNNVITPRIKEGDYAGGIIAGAEAFQQAIKGTYKPQQPAPSSAGKTGGISSIVILLLAMLFGGWRRFGSGFFGDNFDSGGGSSFGSSFGSSAYSGGGGGCSGKW
jgi:uncharacterized protein